MIFSIKDLSVSKQILGMKIIRNKRKTELELPHETYIENMLTRFSMNDSKEVRTSLSNNFKLFCNLSLHDPPFSMWQASYYPILVE